MNKNGGAVATINKIAYSSNYEDNDNTDATGSAGAVGLVYAAIAFEITYISFSYSRKFCITLTLSIEAFRYNKIKTKKIQIRIYDFVQTKDSQFFML